MIVINHELVRQRAFQIWETEGRPEGRDVEHWLRAEAEVRHAADVASPDQPATPAKAPATRRKADKAAPARVRKTAGNV
jgi:hypothetical protein